jgi:hypothetical protein
MADYEAAAFESVEQLKERHISELAELTERLTQEHSVKNHWSTQLMDIRRQEKIFFSVKEYEKAEACKFKADKLELQEREANQYQLTEELLR